MVDKKNNNSLREHPSGDRTRPNAEKRRKLDDGAKPDPLTVQNASFAEFVHPLRGLPIDIEADFFESNLPSVTLIANLRQGKMERTHVGRGWRHLQRIIQNNLTGLRLEGWSPIVWSCKDRRREALFGFSDYLVLDVDEGCSVERAIEIFKNFRVLILPTKHHRKPKMVRGVEVTADRFRVVIALERRITRLEDYKATMRAAHRSLDFIDSKCFDGARFFWCSQETKPLFKSENGNLWPVTDASEDDKKRTEAVRTKAREELGEEGLKDPILVKDHIRFKGFGNFRFFFQRGNASRAESYRKSLGHSLGTSDSSDLFWLPSSKPIFSSDVLRQVGRRGESPVTQALLGEEVLDKGLLVLEGNYERYSYRDFRWLPHARTFGENGLLRLWIPYDLKELSERELNTLPIQSRLLAKELAYKKLVDAVGNAILKLGLSDRYGFDLQGIKSPFRRIRLLSQEIVGIAGQLSELSPLKTPETLTSGDGFRRTMSMSRARRRRDFGKIAMKHLSDNEAIASDEKNLETKESLLITLGAAGPKPEDLKSENLKIEASFPSVSDKGEKHAGGCLEGLPVGHEGQVESSEEALPWEQDVNIRCVLTTGEEALIIRLLSRAWLKKPSRDLMMVTRKRNRGPVKKIQPGDDVSSSITDCLWRAFVCHGFIVSALSNKEDASILPEFSVSSRILAMTALELSLRSEKENGYGKTSEGELGDLVDPSTISRRLRAFQRASTRFMSRLLGLKLLACQDPTGYIPGKKPRMFRLTAGLMTILRPQWEKAMEDGEIPKIMPSMNPSYFNPVAGEFNQSIFKLTAHFNSLEDMVTYMATHHKSFLREKPERWRQVRSAWRHHEKRRKLSGQAGASGVSGASGVGVSPLSPSGTSESAGMGVGGGDTSMRGNRSLGPSELDDQDFDA